MMNAMKEISYLGKCVHFYGKQLGVSGNVHLNDFIFSFLMNHTAFDSTEDAVSYYFNDGRKSANKLHFILKNLGSRFHENLSLLEFASGYGCVSRHLPLVMPHIKFTACDIHLEAIRFISEQLKQEAVLSHSDPENLHLEEKYDVIFSLSFFSHMPRETWGKWISAHFKHLKEGGALIFTTHGLLSKQHLGNPEIPSDGFWFKPYSEQLDLPTAEYGVTLVTKDFVQKEVQKQINRPLHTYKEGFWWDHQDLYIVTKN